MKNKLSDYFRILLPDFWIMNYGYSQSWDKALNRLMDEHAFKVVNTYTAMLGDTEVWIQNMPYAAFRPLIPGKDEGVRPSRLTIAKAIRHLKASGWNPEGEFDNI